jgi:hypothetical protein
MPRQFVALALAALYAAGAVPQHRGQERAQIGERAAGERG